MRRATKNDDKAAQHVQADSSHHGARDAPKGGLHKIAAMPHAEKRSDDRSRRHTHKGMHVHAKAVDRQHTPRQVLCVLHPPRLLLTGNTLAVHKHFSASVGTRPCILALPTLQGTKQPRSCGWHPANRNPSALAGNPLLKNGVSNQQPNKTTRMCAGSVC